jgi:alpha-tubulin suppressor-like RCC1 family protein
LYVWQNRGHDACFGIHVAFSIQRWIMRALRSLFIAVLTLASATQLIAQDIVDVRVTQPPPDQLSIADLWSVELNNRSGRTLEVRLVGTIEETSVPDGLIVEATSRVLKLAPGRVVLTNNDVQPITTANENRKYIDAVLQTGSVPSGDYTLCCEVISAETELTIGRDCKFTTVNRMTQPMLIMPADEGTVLDKMPVFSWLAGTPPRRNQRVLYKLTIAEMFGAQTPFDAIERNPAFLGLENLTATVQQYPVSARRFEVGRKYAWMVTAYERTASAQIVLGKSEVWSFTYTQEKLDVAADITETTTKGAGLTDVCPGENWDFELGSLACWTAEGDIWLDQPTPGKHPVIGDVSPERTWWVTTRSATLGEKALGTLVSEEVQLKSSGIGLLFGGSGSPDAVVELYVERLARDTFRLTSKKLPGSDRDYWVAHTSFVAPERGRKATTASDRLSLVEWDVRPFLNRAARIVIADRSSVGHVNVDNVRFYDLEKRDSIAQPVTAMAAGERHSLAVTPQVKITKTVNATLAGDVGKLRGGALSNDFETVVDQTSPGVKARVKTFADANATTPSFTESPKQTQPPASNPLTEAIAPSSESKLGNFASSKLPPANVVWAWGSNDDKQAARSTGALVSTPQIVSPVRNIDGVAAGMAHAVAIGRDSKLYVWGKNDYYQLGLGASKRDDVADPASYTTLKVAKVSAGARHTMVLGANGYIYVAGYNQNGEAGLNVTEYRDPTSDQVTAVLHIPVLFPIMSLSNIVDVAAGANHSVALGANGSVFGWGVNNYGQAGVDPDEHQIAKPALISSGPTMAAVTKSTRNIVAVAAGDYHSMALAADGSVYTWGGNASGQLGDGTTKDRHQMARVDSLSNIRAIAAGSTFSLALDTAGRVWAWGNNAYGQLGTGDRVGVYKPVQVSRLDAVTGMVAGGAHAMAVRADGSLWTWGTNEFGQLGEGPVVNLTPVQTDPPLGPMRVERLATPE